MNESQKIQDSFCYLVFFYSFVNAMNLRHEAVSQAIYCRVTHEGRDTLSKQYSILFVVKAGRNL